MAESVTEHLEKDTLIQEYWVPDLVRQRGWIAEVANHLWRLDEAVADIVRPAGD